MGLADPFLRFLPNPILIFKEIGLKTENKENIQAGRAKLSTACISRAGREPGFKKQNQDNCFAFDKYTQDGRALFGAFDGHGPEGKVYLLVDMPHSEHAACIRAKQLCECPINLR